MIKMITILTFGLLCALLVTACAQPTPEPNDFPSPPPTPASSTPAPSSTPASTAEVSTSVSSGPVTSAPLSSTSQPPTDDMPGTGTTPGGQKIVTRDDQGKTITMNTGDSFLLQLGDVYTWDISISDQAILSRVMNIAVIKGAQGVYIAHQPGTVTLIAAGDPLCRQSQPPCMMPSIAFKVTVVVK